MLENIFKNENGITISNKSIKKEKTSKVNPK